MPIDGGAVQGLASGDWLDYAVEVDATRVYWNDAWTGKLFAMPRAGGPIETLAEMEADGFGLVLDATDAYFTGSTGLYRVSR